MTLANTYLFTFLSHLFIYGGIYVRLSENHSQLYPVNGLAHTHIPTLSKLLEGVGTCATI